MVRGQRSSGAIKATVRTQHAGLSAVWQADWGRQGWRQGEQLGEYYNYRRG